jgi:hypothetical protein
MLGNEIFDHLRATLVTLKAAETVFSKTESCEKVLVTSLATDMSIASSVATRIPKDESRNVTGGNGEQCAPPIAPRTTRGNAAFMIPAVLEILRAKKFLSGNV